MLAGLPLALEPGASTVAAPEVMSPTRGSCLAPRHAHLAGVGTCLRAAAPHEAPPEAPRSPAPGLLGVLATSLLVSLPEATAAGSGHYLLHTSRRPYGGLCSLGLLPQIPGYLLSPAVGKLFLKLCFLWLVVLGEAQSAASCRLEVRREGKGILTLNKVQDLINVHLFTERRP